METFKEYINEISIIKLKKLYKLKDEQMVHEFVKEFNIKEKIVVKKSNISFLEKRKNLFYIEYSNQGLLIHELLHILQFIALKNNINELEKYIDFDPENLKESLPRYALQTKELNNQAISVAYTLNEKGLNLKNYNSIDSNDRLSIYLNIMTHLSGDTNLLKKRDKLFDLINKYQTFMKYIDYENKELHESLFYGPSFI